MAYNPQNPNGSTSSANSSPVVIANDQAAIPVTGTFWQTTQPVSIAASVAVTGPLTDTQLRASAVPVSLASLPSLATGSNAIGSITNTTFASTQSGTWNVGLSAGSNVIGSISNTSFAATQATAANLNATVSIAASQTLATVTSLTQMNGQAIAMGTGVRSAGTQRVTIATDDVVPVSQSGTWNIGAVTSITNAVTVSQGTATSLKTQAENYQGGSAVSSSNPLYVTVASSISGGDSTYHLVSAATTNATNIKASAGKVTGWYIYNSNANARKVAFHNTAGTPIAGASIHSAIVIPGLAATNVSFPDGIDFGTGIAITTVTDLTDAGNTAVGINDLIINIYYK